MPDAAQIRQRIRLNESRDKERRDRLARLLQKASKLMQEKGICIGALAFVDGESEKDAKPITSISGVLVKRRGEKDQRDFRSITIVEVRTNGTEGEKNRIRWRLPTWRRRRAQ